MLRLVELPLEERQRVAVVGLGYVGCVTAACMASLGHHVIGVDLDEFKVQCIQNGEPPFYEPGLGELIRKGRELGRLHASSNLSEALPQCGIGLICVGTPSERNGNPNLGALTRIADELSPLLSKRPGRFILVVRSTVWPGTCETVVMPRVPIDRAACVANPEFLREGTAIRDFLEPRLLVIGGAEAWARERVAKLYSSLGIRPALVSLRTAELIKYACNAFHATKVTFANEIATIAHALDVSAHEVMGILCEDTALNISSAYLKPGFAFGGSCLPKDLRALVHRSIRLDLNLPLLSSVLPSNEQHILRGIRSVLDLPYDRIGIFGLAFKNNTDDLRESPSVRMVETLIGKGRSIRVFDPHAHVNRVYGSNRRFVLQAIPHIEKLVNDNLDDLLNWAECLVLMQNPDGGARAKISSAGIPIFDLAGGHPAEEAYRQAPLEIGLAEMTAIASGSKERDSLPGAAI